MRIGALPSSGDEPARGEIEAPPPLAQWEEISKQMDTWLEKAALAQVTPQDAATGMQQAATSIYKP